MFAKAGFYENSAELGNMCGVFLSAIRNLTVRNDHFAILPSKICLSPQFFGVGCLT
jgi:hypothetical protein